MAYEYTRQSQLRSGTCFLLKPVLKQDENGVVKRVGTERVETFCKVGSIYGKEVFEAIQAGFQPGWRLQIMECEYDGQLAVEFEGCLYCVYRSFYTNDEIELYVRTDTNIWETVIERIQNGESGWPS